MYFGFSTLYGSKWVATRQKWKGRHAPDGFSTLYGSKWVATCLYALYSLCVGRFQYPLRVEVGCNSFPTMTATVAIRVSVPSTGRSGLQRQWHVCRLLAVSFQYPLRVEVGCNATTARNGSLQGGFSTLYGSKWVATLTTFAFRDATLGFSTLYGSKWVATLPPLAGGRGVEGFSTLYGSKWVATSMNCAHIPRVYLFQYPLRVEVGCNPNVAHKGTRLPGFQYPLRVEVGCNDSLFQIHG
mgnify:CR=1 FL=1